MATITRPLSSRTPRQNGLSPSAVGFPVPQHRAEVPHLIALLHVVRCMKDGILFREIHNLAVGTDAVHPRYEAGPFLRAEEAVAQHKAAAQQVLANLGGLRVGQSEERRVGKECRSRW